MPFVWKVLVSAVLVAGVSELARRSTVAAAVLASLPVTSILALTWLYRDTGSVEKVSELSAGIFWAVLPSLLFFLVLPFFLKHGVKFPWAMTLACAVMAVAYSGYVLILRRWGIGI